MVRIALLAVGVILLSSDAVAAQAPAGRAGDPITRVEATLVCVSRHRAELDRSERLLVEARDQMRAHAPASPEHADAARSAEAMEERIATVGRAIAECAPAPRAASPTRAAEPERGAEASVDTRSSLEAQAVSGPITLTEGLQVVRGLKVDGIGEVDPAALNRAVARVAQGLHRCYEQARGRGALGRGALDVVFTVRADGRTLGHAIEGSSLGDPSMEACVARVARRIDARTRATGGDATFSYQLRFGPR